MWRQRQSSCYQTLICWNRIICYSCLVNDSLISVLGTTEHICIQETATLLLWKFVFSFALWSGYPWGSVPTLETFEWLSFGLAREMYQLLENGPGPEEKMNRTLLRWEAVRDIYRYQLREIDKVRGPAMLTGHKVGWIGLAVCRHPTAKQYTYTQSETVKSTGRKMRTKENGVEKADW